MSIFMIEMCPNLEIMDYGYPQILDPDLLKTYITQGKGLANLNVIKYNFCH